MKMKNKLILIIITILFSLITSGCWDSIELKNREIISAIGIDKGEEKEKISLTFQSIIPHRLGTPMKSESEQKSMVHVISVNGDSVSNALMSFRLQLSKSVYLHSNKVIVIGEDLAREGLSSVLDFFLRYDESRSRALVVVSKDKASDILNWNSEDVSIPSDYILDLITSTNKISPVPKVDMHTLKLKLFSKTTSPLITCVEIVPQKIGPPHIKYTGAGVFDKDKLVGWLNVKETEAFLWITNETDRGFIEAFFPANENKNVTLRVTNIKTKIYPQIDDNNITISLDINDEGSLVEKDSKEDINSPDAIKAIEKSLNEKIKKDIEACLQKAQKEYKADIFGFGEAVHRKHPGKWKELEGKWKELYPNVKVNVNVHTKIRGTGLIIDSFKKQ